jgi:OFA family oxalate/formate antiporter-like MFS transporter
MAVGAVLIMLGWVLGGTVARSAVDLCLYYGVVTGTGAGIIYIATAANAVKWFPDHRGLATGLTSAGFGGGAALSIIPIAATITARGWAQAMTIWGVILGAIAFAMAMVLRHPPDGWKPAGWVPKVTKTIAQTKVNYTWQQALVRPEFYMLYFMFLVMTTGGLMTIANLSEVARSLNVHNAKVMGVSIVAFTATLNGITNAFSRIMWGTISDKIGRENTMALAFSLEGVLILLVTQIVGNPMLFVMILPFVFLSWGETSSLIPSCLGDVFGPKNATAIYGLLYTSKGFSSILAGVGAAALVAYFAGSFQVPYYFAGLFDLTAGTLAFVCLKPMVRRKLSQESA